VLQLNVFRPELRQAAIEILSDMAGRCDGVRCDMAMLVMNETFARTWGSRAGEQPADDYWLAVIPAIRQTHPDFRFIAEAYWDLEWALQQQGFDYCYDKRLYDRLLHEGAEQVRQHLLADDAYQDRLVRFLENHDEPRAAGVLDQAREQVMAVTTLTQSGARLVHDGQLEGRKVRLPVFLRRYPDEDINADLAAFYDALLAALRDDTFHTGTWQLCERSGWPGNDSFAHPVAWSWSGASRWLVIVNLSAETAVGHVQAPWEDLRGRSLRLVDPTQGVAFERTGDDLRDGLYVELGPWRWHLFRLEPVDEG
jgi:hypothetical protein